MNEKVFGMHGIFFRIFLGFWTLSTLLILAIVVYFSYIATTEHIANEDNVLKYAQTNFDHMKPRISDHAKRSFERDHPFKLPGAAYLFDSSQRSIDDKPVPAELTAFVEKHADKKKPQVSIVGEMGLTGPFFLKILEKRYAVYMIREVTPHNIWQDFFSALIKQWQLLIVSILLSGIFCLFFALYFSRPIRQLQASIHKVSGGDLTVTVDNSVLKRRDEIGELSRDFNSMVAQLKILVDSQKRLLRDISHELRSPLARIQISVALAKRKSSEELKEHDGIEAEVSQLDSMIEQLLLWSKLESGVALEQAERICINDPLQEIIERTDFEAKAFNKSVISLLSESIHSYIILSIFISAIENIIRNAIRFTPPNTSVEVSMERINEADSSYALISVRDYGQGIPNNEIETIFEPFHKIESKNRPNQGTGVGLAIVARAASLHTGDVWVENCSPGLKVNFRIPLSI